MIDPLQILVSLIAFGGVFLLIFAVFRHPAPAEPPVHRRFAAAVGQAHTTVFEQAVFAPLMGLGLVMARRLRSPAIRARIRRDLDASGNPTGYSVDEYLAICLLSSAGLGFAAALIVTFTGGSLALVFGPIAAVAGFYFPLWSLGGAARARLIRIGKQLPYSLDLIALTMGAGSAFTEAIETLIRDDPRDDLNQELSIVLSEMNFGAPLNVAMTHMGERIPLESLRSVVAAIVQSQKLGSTLSVILKDQADMMREQRSVNAEKQAAAASLKLLIPSMLILMAVVVAVFGPMIVRFFTGQLW